MIEQEQLIFEKQLTIKKFIQFVILFPIFVLRTSIRHDLHVRVFWSAFYIISANLLHKLRPRGRRNEQIVSAEQ